MCNYILELQRGMTISGISRTFKKVNIVNNNLFAFLISKIASMHSKASHFVVYENLPEREVILHRISQSSTLVPRERASAGIDCANIAARARRQLSGGARKQKISMPANTVMRYTPWAHIMRTNVGKHLLGRP